MRVRLDRSGKNTIAGVNDEMDDASDQNLAALERFARRLIEAESAKLDAIVERL